MTYYANEHAPTHVLVDSDKKITGVSHSFSYQITLPKHHHYDRVCVKTATIPKSYYSVQEGTNYFYLQELGIPTVITLPAGNYSIRNIKPILAGLLNAGSVLLGNNWTYAVSYPTAVDVDTGKLTFSVINNTGQPQLYVHTRDPSLILGLSMDTWHDFVDGSLTSDNVIDMSGSRHMYIQSNITEENEGVILELENDSAFMGSAVYRCPEIASYSRVLHPQKSNVYNFTLIDHNGEVINLNGAHMSITLILYKHSDTMDLIRKSLPYLLRTISI